MQSINASNAPASEVLRDDAPLLLAEARQLPDGDGVRDIQMHAEAVREINSPQIRRANARCFQQNFNARTNRSFRLQQQGQIHFVYPKPEP